MTGRLIEDTYLEGKKSQRQECVFVMKHGQKYLGVIENYDNNVILLEGRMSSDPGIGICYPQDILLYRSDLVSIYIEKRKT